MEMKLHDEFNSLMRLAQGGIINMNLSNGWTMGSGSNLIFAGERLTQLNGTEVTLSSEVTVQFQSLSQINADAITTDTALVEIFDEGDLGFHGDALIEGGQFHVGRRRQARVRRLHHGPGRHFRYPQQLRC